MKRFDFEHVPHRRLNLLTREWVLVSPQRTERPWSGKVEASQEQAKPYDPACYLCPGNARAGGVKNPQYAGTFVFDNDYPALVPDLRETELNESGLRVARAERGICRVVCFSPRHDLRVARMDPPDLWQVINVWIEQYQSLAALPWIHHVQIFENCGPIVGASNPHPHCQVWGNASLPNEPAKEHASLLEYCARNHSCLLCDYLKFESERRDLLVCENEAFAVVVPYWAVWPFETLVLSKRHMSSIDRLTATECDLLARILKQITTRYDNLFEVPFPYSMGFHQSPADETSHEEWHFHGHYYPPLLRSATVQKFMVGYEMLATPQRDLTPESAALRLREAGDVHYLDRKS
ncbi:MAG: UDP-glucose--hexose-1-phosphate uridylyltransferase [Terriglobales bacterium]